MSEPIQVTEKDLYALIGEQAMIIRVQEQLIARLQHELAVRTSTNGGPARAAASTASSSTTAAGAGAGP